MSPLGSDSEVNALLVGTQWASHALTYSFVNAASSFSTSSVYGYGPSTDVASEPWSPQLSYFGSSAQSSAAQVLGKWAAVANLAFTQVADLANNCGDLRFGFTDVGDAQAEAFSPDIGSGGDVWFSYTEVDASFAPGSFNYLALVHETGHALGLKHPFEPSSTNSTVLPAALDSQSYTVMSYSAQAGDFSSNFTYSPTTPMVLDIEAIQYLYGPNMAYNAADTAYRFRQGGDYHETIWDGGGRDTISYEGTDGAVIDLREGAGSTMGNPVYVLDLYDNPQGAVANVWIARGAVIENASGGAGPDRLTGNEVANALSGGDGNDTISGGAGNDRIDGGTGLDVAVFSGPNADYTVTFNAATGRYAIGDHNLARDGIDVVSGTELFQFSDGVKNASQLAVAASVSGDARSVFILAEGFLGHGLTPNQYTAALEMASSGGASRLASAVGSTFAAVESAFLSATVLVHFGISAGTLGGGSPDASFAALQDALAGVFGADAGARGQVVLNLGGLLSGLESDSVYGQAAAAFQNLMAGDLGSVAPALVGLAPQDAALA